MDIITQKIVMEALKDKQPIVKSIGAKVKISYKWKRGSPSIPVVLPKYIQFNEKIGELCGL